MHSASPGWPRRVLNPHQFWAKALSLLEQPAFELQQPLGFLHCYCIKDEAKLGLETVPGGFKPASLMWCLLGQELGGHCSPHVPHTALIKEGWSCNHSPVLGSALTQLGYCESWRRQGLHKCQPGPHLPTKTAEPQPTLFLLYPGLWALLFSPLCKVVRFDKVIFSSWTELLFLRVDQLVSCKLPRVEVNQEKGHSDGSFYVSQIICILILCL